MVGLTNDECCLIHNKFAWGETCTAVPKELWKCFLNKLFTFQRRIIANVEVAKTV